MKKQLFAIRYSLFAKNGFKKLMLFMIAGIWFMGVLLFFPGDTFAATNLAQIYPFGQVTNLGSLVTYLIPIAFSVAGLMFAFYFLMACFHYINSQGDKNAVTAARQQIIHSIIGLILIIAAFVVVRYMPTAFKLVRVPPIFGP